MKKPNRIALWIDSASAHFFIPFQDMNTVQIVYSGIESHPREPGGAPDGTHWDSRSSANEFKKDQREKELYRRYFDELKQILNPYAEILLMGHGQTKRELKNKLLKNNSFKEKTLFVESIDTLSDKHFTDWADCYFRALDAGKNMLVESKNTLDLR